jgi:hypothetical protein
MPFDDMILPEIPEEDLEMDYEPAEGGTLAYLRRAEDEVGPMELADLLGPESGHGDEDAEPLPLGEEVDPAMSAAGPVGSFEEDRTFEDPGAQQDARDMLALRAQERLAASREFQEKASQMAAGSSVGKHL